MKPCDCKDMMDTRELNEQGIGINNYRIEVAPMSVIIETTNFSWKLPQSIFKRFAEWYLEDQEKENENVK